MRSAALACALAAAACGRLHFDALGDGRSADGSVLPPLASLPDGVTSGTRLREMFLAGDEGSRVRDPRYQLYDETMGAPCGFRVAADGQTRCLPDDIMLDGVHFADAACTQLAGSRTDPSRACYTLYATDQRTGDVYTTGAMLTTEYVSDGMGGCTAFSPFQPSYAVSQLLPPEQFVAATLATIPFGRLSYQEWAAADGALELTSTLVDTQLGTTCAIETDVGQGRPVCGPSTGFNVRFLDAACSMPIYRTADPTFQAGMIFWETTDGAAYEVPCAPRTYHTAGAIVSPAMIYVWNGTGCAGVVNNGDNYATDGGVVDQAMWEGGAYESSTAERLATTMWRSADGMLVPGGGLPGGPVRDAVVGSACSPQVDSAGQLRCIPVPDASDLYATDPSCITGGFFAVSCHFGTTFSNIVTSGAPAGCVQDTLSTIYSNAPASGLYIRDQAGTCTNYAGGQATAFDELLSSGTVIPPTTFVPLTPLID